MRKEIFSPPYEDGLLVFRNQRDWGFSVSWFLLILCWSFVVMKTSCRNQISRDIYYSFHLRCTVNQKTSLDYKTQLSLPHLQNWKQANKKHRPLPPAEDFGIFKFAFYICFRKCTHFVPFTIDKKIKTVESQGKPKYGTKSHVGLCLFDQPIKLLFTKAFVVPFLIARDHFKVKRKPLCLFPWSSVLRKTPLHRGVRTNDFQPRPSVFSRFKMATLGTRLINF